MLACDDNGNHAVLVKHDNSDSHALDVDWIHGLLFWADWNLNTINVMDLNTKQRKVLFNEAIATFTIIAVDPSKGLIFWTEWRGEGGGTIKRASMDGNDRMTITNSSSPFGIALDIFNERVYWADRNTNTISSVDYNGNDRRTILHSSTHIKSPSSLAIFEEKLYWTDETQNDVFVMNKFNGTEVRKFEYTIVLLNQNFQTNVINILAAMVPYAFQKAILSTMKENHNPALDYLIHVFVLMDTRQERNQIRVF
uniref:Uncharacterized protein n=1 Tax=Acrobeloides nanus TaxID=290746 RepID=A0A914EPR5_9BILA